MNLQAKLQRQAKSLAKVDHQAAQHQAQAKDRPHSLPSPHGSSYVEVAV